MAAYRQMNGLKVSCGLTAYTLGAPGPMLGSKYGRTLPTAVSIYGYWKYPLNTACICCTVSASAELFAVCVDNHDMEPYQIGRDKSKKYTSVKREAQTLQLMETGMS